MDHLCYLCLVLAMLSHLYIAALWSSEGKGLTSLLLFVMFIVILFTNFVSFPFGNLGQVCNLIVSIPYLLLKSQSTIFQSCWDSSQREKARI